MELNGKTVLITGASSGIGRELAIQLARKGCRLILIARRYELLKSLHQQLIPHPGGHLCLPCDVSEESQIASICEQILKEKTTPDVLILNAGIGEKFAVHDIDVAGMHRVFATNFFSVVWFVKFLLPDMLARNQGIIAATGSLSGYRGMPKAASYSAGKAALMRFIESLQIDLYGTGVRAILISPGFVKTPMTDQNDFRMPFMISADRAARIIIRGLEKEKSEIHFPLRLSILAKLSRSIPHRCYAFLMHRARK